MGLMPSASLGAARNRHGGYRGPVRADPRHGAGYRRQGHRQPDCRDSVAGAAAALLAGAGSRGDGRRARRGRRDRARAANARHRPAGRADGDDHRRRRGDRQRRREGASQLSLRRWRGRSRRCRTGPGARRRRQSPRRLACARAAARSTSRTVVEVDDRPAPRADQVRVRRNVGIKSHRVRYGQHVEQAMLAHRVQRGVHRAQPHGRILRRGHPQTPRWRSDGCAPSLPARSPRVEELPAGRHHAAPAPGLYRP